MSETYFPQYTEKQQSHDTIIAPNERLSMGQTALMGVQHVVAMFGATVLAPLLMGFDPNVALLMSGVGTLLFYIITRGRVPSYLGSSFAFIGGVIGVSAYAGKGMNPNIDVALGAIIVCGLVYFLIGLLVQFIGTHWIETLMPPVVTGAVVAVIGLNLAGVAVVGAKGNNANAWYMLMTVLVIALTAVMGTGLMRRLLILVGVILATVFYALLTNGLGLGVAEGGAIGGATVVDFSKIAQAAWFGLPNFATPTFKTSAVSVIAPVALILVAENLGHLRAVQGMTGHDMNPYMGRAFMADGLATMVSGGVGGTGVTTYAENIGVMAVTKIYSTLVFVFAAIFAIVLGFSPKMGALIQTIPTPVLGGVSIVVFGLIAVSGAKIWVDNKVDFSQNRNLIVAAVTLIVGAGDFTVNFFGVTLNGIGVATFGAMALYALLNMGRKKA